MQREGMGKGNGRCIGINQQILRDMRELEVGASLSLCHSPVIHHSVLLQINMIVLSFLNWDTKRRLVEFPQHAGVRAFRRCASYTRKQKKDKIGPLAGSCAVGGTFFCFTRP